MMIFKLAQVIRKQSKFIQIRQLILQINELMLNWHNKMFKQLIFKLQDL